MIRMLHRAALLALALLTAGPVAAQQIQKFGIYGPVPAGTNVIGGVTQSGGPWSVSGTLAATQSGPWTVAVSALPSLPAGANTIGSVNVLGGNAVAVKTDGSATTQPVSAASWPLPTGAATAAKQPALGVAGTPATDVISVQGIANGTPQPVSGTVALGAGAASIGTIGNSFLLDATFTTRINTLGQKTSAASTPVVLPSDGVLPLPTGAATAANQAAPGTAGTPSAQVLSVQGVAGGTAQPVSGTVALGAGAASIGTVGLNTGANTIGTVNQGSRGNYPGWAVAEVGSPDATAGIPPVIINTATSLVLKGGAGNLYGVHATNLTATAAFLTVVNAASAPTSGAAITPIECRVLPASGEAAISYGAGPPDLYTTGITALISTSCTTYTPASLSAFIKGRVR